MAFPFDVILNTVPRYSQVTDVQNCDPSALKCPVPAGDDMAWLLSLEPEDEIFDDIEFVTLSFDEGVVVVDTAWMSLPADDDEDFEADAGHEIIILVEVPGASVDEHYVGFIVNMGRLMRRG